MLFTPKVQAALEAKQSHFTAYQNSLQEQQGLVADWLAKLAQQSTASLSALLDERGVTWPGARPTTEFDRAPTLLFPFDSHWGNHVDARGWAMSVLKERPVAAVDGCISGVIGLPLVDLRDLLATFGVHPPRAVLDACQPHTEFPCCQERLNVERRT